MPREISTTAARVFAHKSEEFYTLAAFGRGAESDNESPGAEFMAAFEALLATESKPKTGAHKAGVPLLCGKYSAKN